MLPLYLHVVRGYNGSKTGSSRHVLPSVPLSTLISIPPSLFQASFSFPLPSSDQLEVSSPGGESSSRLLPRISPTPSLLLPPFQVHAQDRSLQTTYNHLFGHPDDLFFVVLDVGRRSQRSSSLDRDGTRLVWRRSRQWVALRAS